MIIQKIIEFKLDLINSNDIYTPNIEETAKRLLANKFVGKCFKSCYILNINRILKTSEIYMSEDLNGSAYCDVCFEVDGLIYLKGEIITGCVIRKIESGGQTYAETDKVSLQFNQDPSLSIYKEGYVIPAIIDKVRYPINKEKISALALPFCPVFPPVIIYQIDNKTPTDEEKACLERLFVKISDEENKVKDLKGKTKSYEFFKNLLYPFKKVQPISSNKYKSMNFKELDISQLDTVKDGYICRPHELEKFRPIVYYSNNMTTSQSSINISINTKFEISLIMMQDYLQYLITLRELTDYYPDFQNINKYADIWKIYNHLKKTE